MSNNTNIEGESPNKAWYLLPIFFGLLGGIVMYFIVREDNKQMAKNGLILSVILTVVGIIIVILMNVIMFSTFNSYQQ